MELSQESKQSHCKTVVGATFRAPMCINLSEMMEYCDGNAVRPLPTSQPPPPLRDERQLLVCMLVRLRLTWKWFHDIAPHEMQPLSGRMWWSFYESDASFENFVIRALAYVSRRPEVNLEQILRSENEQTEED